MAKLSDILAKATAKLKGVGASVADAIAPATPSILAKDAPTSSNIGGSGVSLFEAKPGQKVDTIGDSVRKGLEGANKYIESSPILSSLADENIFRKGTDALSTKVSEASETIGGIVPLVSDIANDFKLNYNPSETSLKAGEVVKSGIEGAGLSVTSAPGLILDTKDNFNSFLDAVSRGDKSEAARKLLDTGTSAFGAAFSATPFGLGVRAISGGAMGATGANKAIQGGKENIAKSVSSLLGTDEKETLDWVSTLSDTASVVAGIKGAKISQYKPTDVLKTKTANLLKGAAVGSSADAFVAMFDTGEGKDKAIQGASLFLVNAFPSPLEAPKGTNKNPSNQTSLDITPPKGMDITDAEAVKTETPVTTEKKTRKKKVSESVQETTTVLPEEVPTVYDRQKQPVDIARENVEKYADYARGVLASGKMPNGKKVTKKQVEFIRKEYISLVKKYEDERNAGVTQKEEVQLAGNKGVEIRDKRFILPEKAETSVEPTREQYLADLEQKRQDYYKEQEDAQFNNRMEQELYEKNKQEAKNINAYAREQYLADLEKQRAEYDFYKDRESKQPYIDEQSSRLKSEYEQYKSEQENIQPTEKSSFEKFNDTNPTEMQTLIANKIRAKLDEGKSPRNIMELGDLTNEQQRILIEGYQKDLEASRINKETQGQETPTQTQESSMIDGEPPIVKEIENSVKPHVIENPSFRLTLGNALNKLRGFVATNVTIKSLLNNVIVNSADGKTGQSLGNYLTQGVRGISSDVAKKVFSTFFPKESVDFTLKVKPEDLIGGVTPEGIEITQKNVGEFMKTFDDISHEKLGAGFIDAEVKDLNKMQKASFVYDLVKNMPDKLKTLFTDAQIKILQSLESKEKELYSSLSKYLVDNGVIGKNDSSDGYIRFVMGQLGFDRLKRIAGEKVSYIVTNGLSTHEFDNIIDAERFIKFSNKFNKEQPFDYDAATRNSLGKEKGGANLDIFRTHGAVNRMISYADMIGKLEADKFAGDTIAKAANGTNTHVNEYLGQAFKSGMHSNILPEILGVNTGEKGIVDKLGNVGTGLQMGANVISGLSQLMSTGVKTGLFGVANAKSVLSDVWKTYQKEGINKAVSALGVMKDQALKNLLASEGYNTSYEVMPMSTNTTGGRIKNFLMELGTANRWVESPAKSFIAQVIMRKVLKNNGYDATDIVNNWNKFKQEKPNEYKMARDSILDWTNWISDVSSSARLQLGDKNVRSLLGKIKTYTIDQIDTSVRDLASAPDLALRAAFGDKPVDAYTKQHGIDGLKRLGASIAQQATWFVPTLISTYVALSDDSDTDEEKEVKRALAFEIAMEKTAKYGSPGVALDATALLSMLGTGFQGKNILRSEQGLVGSIATSPVNATAGLAYMLLSLTAEKEHMEIEAMRGLDKILKSFGGGRVSKAVATEAGITPEDTPNFSEKTGNLLEKSVLGKNTFIDRATGFNRNQVIENFLRNQIGKVNKEDKGFIEGIAGNISDYLSNTSILRDWSALLEDMKDQDTKKVAYDSFLIAKNLPDKGYKTVKDALIGEGIVALDNPDIDKYEQLVTDAIIEQSQIGGGSVMGENLQDKVALGINTVYNPISINGAEPVSQQVMQSINGNLFKDNPRLYTQTVGLLAKLKNGYGRSDDAQQLSFENIVKDWKGTPTNERIDAMVADATNTRALSDTITYALDGKIKEFSSSLDDMIAKGISPDAKGKESIMNTLKTFDTLYGVSESIGASPRAMPISAAETMRGIFEKMRVAGMTNELKEVGKNMKNLYNTVVKGLLLRGEVMPESTNNVQETGAGTGSLPISQVVRQATTPTTPTTQTTQVGTIPEPFIVPKWKNLKNEWKGAFPKQQAPSTTRTKEPKLKKMSLSEMLARSRQ